MFDLSAKSVIATLGWLAPFVVTACLVPSTAHAAQVRKGDHVEVSASETIDDSLIAMGESVVIDGHVTGDAVAFARSVTVTGTIDGNLVTAGAQVDISGTVGGSVMTAGQDVGVSGVLGSQLYAAGNTVTLDQLELVGDALLAGDHVDVGGALGRDVYASGNEIEVDATLARDLVLTGAELNVLDSASVGRNLEVKVADADDLSVNHASIAGLTKVDVGALDDDNPYDEASFYMRKLVGLAAGLLFGLVAFVLVPGMFQAPREQSAAGRWPRVVGVGFAVLLVTPIAALIAAVTLIGLPLAALAMAGYVLALYLGKLFVAAELGRRILKQGEHKRGAVAWSLLLGLVIVSIATELPLIGGLIGFAIAVIGVGSVASYVLDWRRQRTQSPATSP